MIARYISELLFIHDCVIIPGFGGLIAQPVGASFNHEYKKLIPPSRKLIFNNQLVINDGLLVNYISRKEKISYAGASLQLMKWTEEIRSTVNAGNRFSLEGIGSFYLNHEKKLQFSPDKQNNFLLSSFGLKPVAVLADAKGKIRQIAVSKKAGKSAVSKTADFISTAAAIALLIASVLMFPKFEMNLASLAGFRIIKQDGFQNKNLSIKPSEIADEMQPEERQAPPEVKHSVESAPDDFETAAKAEINSSPVSVSETEQIVPESETAEGSYYIIAGCFKIEENAGKLLERLSAQGLQAAIIGKSKAGLTMVSAGRFTSSSEASKELNDLKSLLPDGGWVYHQITE
ncbi:MAG: SPOR domain-containing protein [Bacteroidia bacterium]|nr:SPOR domain-containing protein [Bacteroidia bacterium]